MSIDSEIYFYYFNYNLITNLKKIVYDEYFKSLNYDYTNVIPKSINDIFTPYKLAVYTKKDGTLPTLTGDSHDETSIKPGSFNNTQLKLNVSPTYRLTYTNNEGKIFDYFTFDYNTYITGGENINSISSKFDFSKWSTLLPNTMLNVCQKTLSDQFYYRLLGYQSQSNSIYNEFTAPIKKFDAAGDLSAVVVCSLRLINSDYTSYCCSISKGEKTPQNVLIEFDIKFDPDTGMISYRDLDKYIIKNSSDVWRIVKFYNQMEKSPSVYFTSGYTTAPILLSKMTEQNIKIYSLQWENVSYMKLTNDISVNKVNNPYFTVCTNIKFETIKTFNEMKIFSSNVLSVAIDDASNIKACTIEKEDVYAISQKTVQGSLDNLMNGFHTLNISNAPTIPIFYSDTTYEQKNNIETKTPEPLYKSCVFNDVPSWMDVNNKNINKDVFPDLRMSEMIIFLTDEAVVKPDVLQDISEDSHSVWNNTFNLINPDLRCNNTVPIACEIDNKNKICACYASYVDGKSSNTNKMINDIDKTSFANKDVWCLNPDCANRMAYKNPIAKNSSVCSSTCSSSIHANTQKHGNLNIENTQVMSLCDNQSSRTDYTSPCGTPNINEVGMICSFNNTSQKWEYVKNTSCTTECDDQHQCIIYDGDKQKCIPIANSIKKCIDSSSCLSTEYCNTSVGLCFSNNVAGGSNIFIAIGIFIATVVVIGLLFFFIYKKSKKSKNKNIWMFIVTFGIGIIAVVLYYVIKGTTGEEMFSDTICKTDSQCSNNNSHCSDGICTCDIGYSDKTCVLDKIKICTNFPYLPLYTTAGSYYYITKTSNGNIYAFGLESSFKYNGEKWQEVTKLSTQMGFSPYRSFIETEVNDKFAFNSNMCSTYKDSIFVFAPMYSQINNNTTNTSYLLKFEDKNKGEWTTITIDDPYFKTLSVYNGSYINNIVTVIVDNKLYIFGGFYMDNNKSVINKYVGIYDIISGGFSTRNLVPDSGVTKYSSLRFFNYSKAIVSKDKEIYLIGVRNDSNIPADVDPVIYKYLLSNDKTVKFTKVGTCPNISDNINIKSNNGGVVCYMHEYNNKEYITILARTDNKSEIIWRTELGDNTQGKYIQMYKPSNQSNITKRDNLISNLLFSRTISMPVSTYVSCYLEMNGLLFLVNGYGDIMRCNNYQQDIADKFNIVPCYGVELYEQPLYNVKRCTNTPGAALPGWKWSDILCGYYKLPFIDVNTSGCTNYGAFCDGYCKADNECGTGWTTTIMGDCNITSDKCRMLCKLNNVKKDFYYCDKNSKAWQKCTSDSCDGGIWDSTSKNANTKCYFNTKSELSSYCASPVS